MRGGGGVDPTSLPCLRRNGRTQSMQRTRMTPRRAPVTTVAPAKITYTDHEGSWIEWSGVVGHLSNA